ncbi:MAG: rRNA maturation RNase YbeY [Flavobacterium sp. BFFFF2]|nr:MAG: rRNA maturation RNase YbeY [Flavobacterium sp. BFFFF2]
MIIYNYETDFKLPFEEALYSTWIGEVVCSEGKTEGEISYVFCDDEFLLNINQTYLDHDTFTDIITFDYCVGDELNSDIFISIPRVEENATLFNTDFHNELLRVMVHGVLHLCGYKDKSEQEEVRMRQLENDKIQLFHVKQS